MRTAAAAIISLWAAQAAAWADPFESYDPEPLNACIASAGADGAALEACKGAGARPCVATDGAATSSYVLCWSYEADAWDAVTAARLAERNTQAPERAEALNAAQAAWAAWREAECMYRAEPTAGGSGVQVDMVLCAATLSADRAISLLAAQ